MIFILQHLLKELSKNCDFPNSVMYFARSGFMQYSFLQTQFTFQKKYCDYTSTTCVEPPTTTSEPLQSTRLTSVDDSSTANEIVSTPPELTLFQNQTTVLSTVDGPSTISPTTVMVPTTATLDVCVDNCTGLDHGSYQHCHTCTKSVGCWPGGMTEDVCPTGLVWDDEVVH